MGAQADRRGKPEIGGGRYQILAKLGEGGMALVYRAHDRHLSTDVVIKVPHKRLLTDDRARRRFAQETGSLVRLAHPHIVKIIDVGEHQGMPFAVMQYLAGGNLADRLTACEDERGINASFERLDAWLHPIADVLDFIHRPST